VTGASGDEAEFRALFDGELSYVLNTLRRLGVREADLPDQTQEVFVVVHALMDDYDRDRPLRPWLFGIAYRTASRYRRLARNARELPTDLDARSICDEAPLADEQLGPRPGDGRRGARRSTPSISRGGASFILSEIDGVAMPENRADARYPR